MPRVTKVAAAAKDQGTCGKCGKAISKGDGYLWWKFRFGGKNKRCLLPECAPKPNDLTQSEWQQRVNDFEEQLGNVVQGWRDNPGDDLPDIEGAASDLDSLAEEVREFGEEQAEKVQNMPEGLQEGDTGQLLTERSEAMEAAADELDRIASELRDLDLVDVTDTDALRAWNDEEAAVDRDDHKDDEDAFLDAIRAAARDKNGEAFTGLLDEAEGVGFDV